MQVFVKRYFSPTLLIALAIFASVAIDLSCTKEAPTSPTQSLKVTSIAPSCGIVGSQVVISGTGFSTVKDGNRVYFYWAPDRHFTAQATIDSCTSTHLYVRVPENSGTGSIAVVTGDLRDTSKDVFTIVKSHFTITKFTPLTGASGSIVTITGTGFDTVASPLHVLFGRIAAKILSVTPTMLTVRVPFGAGTSPIIIEGACQTDSTLTRFTEIPTAVLAFTPQHGVVGTSVKIHLNTRIDTLGLVVKFGSVIAAVDSVNDTSLVVRVPKGAMTSQISISVNGEMATSATPFTVVPLMILSMTPTSGPKGTIVSIKANVKLNSTVILDCGNQRTQIVSVQESTVVVRMLGLGASEPIELILDAASAFSDTPFVFTPRNMQLSNFSPTWGRPSTQVIMAGFGFTPDTFGLAVYFGSVKASVISSTVNQIEATVPQGATTSLISIICYGDTLTSVSQFAIVGQPKFKSFSIRISGVAANVNGGTQFRPKVLIDTEAVSIDLDSNALYSSRPDDLSSIGVSESHQYSKGTEPQMGSVFGSRNRDFQISIDTATWIVTSVNAGDDSLYYYYYYDQESLGNRFAHRITAKDIHLVHLPDGSLRGTLTGASNGASLLNFINSWSTWQGHDPSQTFNHSVINELPWTDSTTLEIVIK